MQFEVNRSDFTEALRFCMTSVESRATIPILSNALITGDPEASTLTIETTDLEIASRATMPATVMGSGSCAVPGRKLYDLSDRLSGDILKARTTKQDHLGIECASVKARLNALSSDSFPEIPEPVGEGVTVPCVQLAAVIRGASYASAESEARYVMKSVWLRKDARNLTAVCLDGHRMAHSSAEVSTAGELDVKIFHRAARELTKILSNQQPGSNCVVHSDANMVWVVFSDRRFTFRHISEKYADGTKAVPRKFSGSTVVDLEEIMGMFKRAELFVGSDIKKGETQNPLWVEIKDGRLSLRMEGVDEGSFEESMGVEIEGEPLEAIYKLRYLAEAIRYADTKAVRLLWADALKPLKVESIQGLVSNYGVVMPRR